MKKKYEDQTATENITISNSGSGAESNLMSVLPTLEPGDAIVIKKVTLNATWASDDVTQESAS